MHKDSINPDAHEQAEQLVKKIAPVYDDEEQARALFCLLAIITNPKLKPYAEDVAMWALRCSFVYTPEFEAAVEAHAGHVEPEAGNEVN
jgi:hypothetical protein